MSDDRAREYRRLSARSDAPQRSSLRAYVAIRSAIREGLIDASAIDDRSLSRLLDVTRNGVRSALKTLNAEGFISRRQRVGTSIDGRLFESDADNAFLPRAPLLPADRLRVEKVATERVVAPPWVRKMLQIDGVDALLYECRTLSGNDPVALQLNYYHPDVDPEALFQRGIEMDSGPTYDTLAERFEYLVGHPLGRVTTSIEAVSCDAQIADRLAVAEGSPILLREYLLFDRDDRCRVLSYSYARGDRAAVTTQTDRLI